MRVGSARTCLTPSSPICLKNLLPRYLYYEYLVCTHYVVPLEGRGIPSSPETRRAVSRETLPLCSTKERHRAPRRGEAACSVHKIAGGTKGCWRCAAAMVRAPVRAFCRTRALVVEFCRVKHTNTVLAVEFSMPRRRIGAGSFIARRNSREGPRIHRWPTSARMQRLLPAGPTRNYPLQSRRHANPDPLAPKV